MKEIRLIYSFFLLLFLLSCSKNNSLSPNGGNESNTQKAFLTFNFTNEIQSLPKAPYSRSSIYTQVEHGISDGEEYENEIHNIHIFLFKQRTSNPTSSQLVFSKEYDKSSLIRYHGSNYYHTPVELIQPGNYVLYICVNTKFNGKNHIDDINASLGTTFAQFSNAINQLRATDYGLNDNDKASLKSNGLFADILNTNFIVPPKYTSENNPFVSEINFSRALSKLKVTITNVEHGKKNDNSSEYYVRDIQLRKADKYYLFNSIFTAVASQDNIQYSNTDVVNKIESTIWNKISNQTFAFNEKMEETTLFEIYLAPSALKEFDEVQKKDYVTQLTVTVQKKGNNNISKVYSIPIYDTEANGVNNFAIKPNTKYEVNIFFKGPEIIATDIYYQPIAWESKDIEIPTFQ